MIRSTLAISILALVSTSAGAADKAAAEACAKRLGADAKQIYDLVAPEVGSSTLIKDVVVEKVRPLVMAGKMSRDAATTAASSAGECLKLLK